MKFKPEDDASQVGPLKITLHCEWLQNPIFSLWLRIFPRHGHDHACGIWHRTSWLLTIQDPSGLRCPLDPAYRALAGPQPEVFRTLPLLD